jgi:heme exporter protein B
MMPISTTLRTWGWLVHKDLLREVRAPRIWPTMLLLGLVLWLVIEMQLELPRDQKQSVAGGFLWLANFFAGTVALERSFCSEREEGCWQALLLYPVTPGTIFLAKLTVNFLILTALEGVLVPAFVLFSDVPLLQQPWQFLATMFVGNLGFVAAGTLIGALTSGLSQRGGLLVLLLLPLVLPVLIGAAQATRALISADASEWSRWMQLLSCFSVLFVSLGTILFEFVIED